MRYLRTLFLTLFVGLLLLPLFSLGASATDVGSASPEGGSAPVSTGLLNLASATDMVVSAEVGELYYFESRDFLRAMNLSGLSYVTITEAPSADQGTLFLGSSPVQSGQVISLGNLDRLTYSPATPEKGVGSFRFSVENAGYSVECRVYSVESIGSRPTGAYAPVAVTSTLTYRDLAYEGRLSGYDADGDALVYEIVSSPAHGACRMLDRDAGVYLYTPQAGYTGEDGFSYVVRDAQGNYSATRAVTVTVSEPSGAYEFVDLDDDRAVVSAIRMEESGVMSGTEVGGKTFFYPEKTVSRVDFLVMAMRTLGVEGAEGDSATVFRDDAEIPQSLRGYVKRAYDLGVVNGSLGEDGLYFSPSRAVTRAEASKILSLLIAVSERVPEALKRPEDAAVSIVELDDYVSIPAWAEEAVCHLSAIGIYQSEGGGASVGEPLLRGEAAEMLASLLHVLDVAGVA